MGVAFCLRLACAIYWHGDTTGVDVGRYLDQSQALAVTHVFTFQGLPTAINAPLFPALLSLFWTPSGFHPFAAQLFFALCGSVTAGLTYLLALRVYPARALIAGLGMALGPMSSRYSVILLTETCFTLLVTLALWLWSRERWKASGVVWGLSLLTRPTGLIFLLLLLPLGLLWRRRSYLLMAVMALLMITPWTVRNLLLFHRLIPIAASGYGNSLLVGTIDLDFRKPMWEQVIHSGLVEPSEIEGKSESEQDAVLMYKAVTRIKANPLGWLKARVKQYPLLYADEAQYLHNGNRTWKVCVEAVFLAGNLCLLILAGCGLYKLRRLLRELDFLLLFPIYLALIHLPMWVESRYSLPMTPALVILAVVGLFHYRTGPNKPRQLVSQSLCAPLPIDSSGEGRGLHR